MEKSNIIVIIKCTSNYVKIWTRKDIDCIGSKKYLKTNILTWYAIMLRSKASRKEDALNVKTTGFSGAVDAVVADSDTCWASIHAFIHRSYLCSGIHTYIHTYIHTKQSKHLHSGFHCWGGRCFHQGPRRPHSRFAGGRLLLGLLFFYPLLKKTHTYIYIPISVFAFFSW